MKIYFNRRPVNGPWGGGSKILTSIVEECFNRNYEVYFEEEINLEEKFDVIFCTHPRANQNVNFNDLLKKKKHLNCKLVQRVGDLGTHGKPELFDLVKLTSQYSDVLIFPSEWAKNCLNVDKECYVIKNAPLTNFFVSKKNKLEKENLKLVSHHWSNNAAKGFDIYKQLDDYCCLNKKIEFTFIGRKPNGCSIKNYLPPQDVEGLISEIPKHDIYITASKYEAGANHVLEAMALGLPVLYHKDGGSINEYCKEFGIAYENFEELIWILENKKEDLNLLSNKINYKRNSSDMAREYLDLFKSISS